MIRVLAIGLLLLYYWYFTRFHLSPGSALAQPSTRRISPMPPSIYHFTETASSTAAATTSHFTFTVDGRPTWQHVLPPGYRIFGGRLLPKDVCHSQPNGQKIVAVGETLYRYVQEERLTPLSTLSFEPDTELTVQHGNLFYFTCQNDSIARLDMCPSGTHFKSGTCQPIDRCTGKPEGFLLPDPFDKTEYYECTSSGTVRHQCSQDQFFFYNECQSKKNAVAYCGFNKDPLYLNEKNFIRCVDNEPVFETCPEGTQLFPPSFICEPDDCVHRPNGTLLALSPEHKPPFRFSRGYIECQSQVPSKPRFCDTVWDPHLSKGDNLTHLPLVFDGNTCSVPSFCENVTADDPKVIVPVHEFTKHVRNWKFSEDIDSVEGFKCESGNQQKKRIYLPVGQRIGKKFKAEPACEPNTDDKVFVSNSYWIKYYDCATSNVEMCPVPQIFDGSQCRDPIPHAHKHQNLGLFSFEGLSFDGWMKNWHYASKGHKTCHGEESNLLPIYNTCFHPKCEKFPFLAQVSFPIRLLDQTECVKIKDVVVNRKSEHRYAFWSQRPVPDNVSTRDSCTPSTKVQSGHFVIDSSIYATCDMNTPFVFCPSPLTTGLKSVSRKYVCDLSDPLKAKLPHSTKVKFMPNELKLILPADSTLPLAKVTINQDPDAKDVPEMGLAVDRDSETELTANKEVMLQLYARITYPPDVAFVENGIKGPVPGQAYLIRSQGFTRKHVNISQHNVNQSLSEFKTTFE